MGTIATNTAITPANLVAQLETLAQTLRESLFVTGGDRVADWISQLATDIRSGKNLDGWHRLDLDDVVEAMITPKWYSRLVVRFGMLLPIGFNWWSIREATSAYSQLSSDQLSQKSFLFWWIQGMDGKLGWYETLPNVAMATVVVISILGVAGLIFGLPQQKLRQEISDHMLAAQVHIGQHVAFTPEEIRGAVSLLLSEMLTAGETLSKNSKEGLEISERISDQFDSLKEFVSAQTVLVGGELKTAVVATTSASNALVKTVEANQAVVASLNLGSQALKDSITPISEMIRGASGLAISSEGAAETLRTMVENVPDAFNEPLGLMMSAVELLAEGTAAAMNQMEGLESLTAVVSNGIEANEVKVLLQKLVSATENIARVQVDMSEGVDNFSQDLRPLLESIESLKQTIDRWNVFIPRT